MSEYYDLNEDSKEEQLKHNELLKQFEAHQRARHIIVPTAIIDVKSKLRELGHPITLYAEDHVDRRNRLREVIARLEIDKESLQQIKTSSSSLSGGVAILNQGPTLISQQELSRTAQKEIFYSPAIEELINARKEIATYSFARAQDRLLHTKRIREDDQLVLEEDKFVHELYMNSKDLTLNSSQVGDDRPLTSIRYSADGKLLATGSFSGVVKLWHSDGLSNAAVFRSTLGRITSVAWHPNSNLDTIDDGNMLLAATSAEGVCHIYDYAKHLNALSYDDNNNNNIVSSNHTMTTTSYTDQDMKNDEDEESSSEGDDMDKDDDIEGINNSNSNTNNTNNNQLNSNSSSNLCVVHKLHGHKGMTTACEFHPSGRYVGTTGSDCTWRLWDIITGTELLIQDGGHIKDLSAISFHPDGSLVMTADSGGVVLLWDIRSGQSIQTFQGHIKKISGLCFNANGFQAASSCLDNTVKIWDIRRKKCAYTLPAHTNVLSDVRYSKSGELLATCSFDGTIKIWSSRDYHILRTLSEHSGKVMSCDFAPDEKHIVSAGYDRTIKLWAHKDEF